VLLPVIASELIIRSSSVRARPAPPDLIQNIKISAPNSISVLTLFYYFEIGSHVLVN